MRGATSVVRLLEPVTGPLVHNPTRGQFLMPNAQRYGSFLQEWGTIYERFGVPAEIGSRLRPSLNPVSMAAPAPEPGHRLLPVPQPQLGVSEQTRAGRARGLQPDDAGAVLRGVPDDPRHDVRQLHSGALGTSRRRRQRRADRHQRRSAWVATTRASSTSSGSDFAARSSSDFHSDRYRRACTGPTDTGPLCMPRWCSATWST